MPLSPGVRLGPYQILAPIGAGGMGEVYRARDTRLDREVAIKVLPEQLAQSPQALSRFVRETKALASLSHPNLLAIFDTGSENGVSFAVMELLEGESLRVTLKRGPAPWRRVTEVGVALAEGLAAAHSKGVTHRDLKPDNIFLTCDARVKVLDFGLARVDPAAAPDGGDDGTQTAAGIVMGTPGYMSPEQVRGEPAGPASDIFSLGCVLYEMASGRRAFPGQSPVETMSSILRDQPAPADAAGVEIPGELHRVIFRCLEKRPEARFQTAHDVASHLTAILNAPAANTTAAAPRGIDSIAVLPFANTSSDADTEYLCEGIAESVMNSLARIPRLRVTPRSTVFRYKSRDLDPQTVGRELNVRAVLTGRVSQRADTLLVATELVDVAAGSQLWGERFHRKIADIFALEEEIARKISESLRVQLSREEKSRMAKRFTEDSEAYQLYLRGRHHWIRRTPDHVQKGAEYFQKAIERDPGYALAYSGLADCFSILGVYSILPPRTALARAKAAAVASVAFDNELAEGHCSLGFIRANFDLDWPEAEKEFRRSIEINPEYWVSRYWFGLVLSAWGRYDEAEEQCRHAMALEPLSPMTMHGAALNALFARRYDVVIERSLKGLEFAPDFFLLRFWLGIAYSFAGQPGEAIEELDKAVELCAGKVSWVVASLAVAHVAAGHRPEAERILQDLLDRVDSGGVDLSTIGMIQCALGRAEEALAWLERSAETGGMLPIFAKGDPRLDSLRADPRFKAVLRRIHLEPAAGPSTSGA